MKAIFSPDGSFFGPASDSRRIPVRKANVGLTLVCAVAIVATLASLGIAIYTGWHSGGPLVERIIRIVLLGVAVLVAHWLPTNWSALHGRARFAIFALWMIALAVVLYGQTVFFIVSQQHAGDLRAAAVPAPAELTISRLPAGRSRTEIAQEVAKVSTALARAQSQRCAGDCPRLKVRQTRLAAELDALNVEADEAMRREVSEDRRNAQAERMEARRTQSRADPVALPVASWFDMTTHSLELIIGLAHAIVLEGAAIVGWLLVSVAPGRGATEPDWESITTVHAGSRNPVAGGREASLPELDTVASNRATTAGKTDGDVAFSEEEHLLQKIHEAVASGQLKPTQQAIRKFLRCGQPIAGHLNRQYLARFGGMRNLTGIASTSGMPIRSGANAPRRSNMPRQERQNGPAIVPASAGWK